MGFEISDSGENLDPPSKIYLRSLYREGRVKPTMAINGCVISGPDPGAVPGASTREVGLSSGDAVFDFCGGGEIGSTDV